MKYSIVLFLVLIGCHSNKSNIVYRERSGLQYLIDSTAASEHRHSKPIDIFALSNKKKKPHSDYPSYIDAGGGNSGAYIFQDRIPVKHIYIYQDSGHLFHIGINEVDKVLMDTTGRIFPPNYNPNDGIFFDSVFGYGGRRYKVIINGLSGLDAYIKWETPDTVVLNPNGLVYYIIEESVMKSYYFRQIDSLTNIVTILKKQNHLK